MKIFGILDKKERMVALSLSNTRCKIEVDGKFPEPLE